MQLIEKVAQSRRDFKGKYKCENCGNIETDKSIMDSYDDDYFHDNVIPNKQCKECGESTVSLGLPNHRVATKYDAWEII